MDILYRLFYIVFSMSLVTAAIVPIVLLLRLLLRRFSESGVLLLWFLFFLRGICPVALSSAFSLVPSWNRKYHLFLMTVGLEMRSVSGNMTGWASVLRGEISVTIPYVVCSVLWFSGVFAIWGFVVWQQREVREKLSAAEKIGDDVYQLRGLVTPVIMGIMHPRMYISDMVTAKEARFVLRHFSVHKRKRDPLWRFLAFAVISIQWFNPLIWLCFFLYKRDLERVRDRQTLREIGVGENKEYAQEILHMGRGSNTESHTIYTFQEEFLLARAQEMLYVKKSYTRNERAVTGIVVFLFSVWCFFLRPLQILWNDGMWGATVNQAQEAPMFEEEKPKSVVAEISGVTPEGLGCIIQLIMLEGETEAEATEKITPKSTTKTFDETLDEYFEKEEKRMEDIIKESEEQEKRLDKEPMGNYDFSMPTMPPSNASGNGNQSGGTDAAGSGNQSGGTDAAGSGNQSGETDAAGSGSQSGEMDAAGSGNQSGGTDAAGAGEQSGGADSVAPVVGTNLPPVTYRGSFALVLKDSYGTTLALQPLEGCFQAAGEDGGYSFKNNCALYASDYNGDGVQELVLGQKVLLGREEWDRLAGKSADSSKSKKKASDSAESKAAVEYTIWNIEANRISRVSNGIFATEEDDEKIVSRLLDIPKDTTGVISTIFDDNKLYYVWDKEKYGYVQKDLTEDELEKYSKDNSDGSDGRQEGEKLTHSLEENGEEFMRVSTHRDDSGSEVIDSVVFRPQGDRKKAEDVEGYYCNLEWVQAVDGTEKEYAVLTYNGTKAQTFVIYDIKEQKEYFRQEDGTGILAEAFARYDKGKVEFLDKNIVLYALMEKDGDMLKISFAASTSDESFVKGSYLYDAVKKNIINFQYSS